MNLLRPPGFRLLVVLSAAAVFGSPGQAAIVWNESVNGDLSSVQGSPTAVTLGVGVNSVIGSVGAGPPADTLDFITIRVPVGSALTGVVLRSYIPGDLQGFTGFQRGSVFVGNILTAAPYAGYAHFGTGATNGGLPPTNLVGADLLPIMANPALALGSQGFTIPLPSGDYAFLIRQTGATTGYQFDFIVATVPEPASICLLGGLCAAGLVLRRNRVPHPAL